MSQNALEIRGLVKSFRRFTLGQRDGFTLGPLDLTVPIGSIYGFVGPNGAGKTTTIDMIFGMGRKEAGTIRVLGLDHLRDEVAMKRQVGYVSPDLNFAPWKRVGRAIDFIKGFHAGWDDQYCHHLLASFRLARDERISVLSFGARIKLALVLALSWRPRFLVLDEPTVGLDAISRQQVFSELLATVRDEGRTVFISSHGIADLERFADHVGMIKDGRLVFEGTTADVLERYRMVEFTLEGPADLGDRPGIYVQRKAADRWSALLDLQRVPIERLQAEGATPIADFPVTLEEVFVAVGKA